MSASWGNIWSNSEPAGVSGKVGLGVNVGMDMEAGNNGVVDGIERKRVAIVAPLL